MSVTVKWGTDAFHLILPPPATNIRRWISSRIHLPDDAFALVLDGAVIANYDATVADCHLYPNSVIAIVANTPEPFKNTEHALVDSIRSELSSLNDTLLPAHTKFLSQLTPQTRSALANERARLAELLLQALLRFDAFILEHDWANARAHRKYAVTQVQSLLDQLDSAWAAAQKAQYNHPDSAF